MIKRNKQPKCSFLYREKYDKPALHIKFVEIKNKELN